MAKIKSWNPKQEKYNSFDEYLLELVYYFVLRGQRKHLRNQHDWDQIFLDTNKFVFEIFDSQIINKGDSKQKQKLFINMHLENVKRPIATFELIGTTPYKNTLAGQWTVTHIRYVRILSGVEAEDADTGYFEPTPAYRYISFGYESSKKINEFIPAQKAVPTIEELLVIFLEKFRVGEIKIASERNAHNWILHSLENIRFEKSASVKTGEHRLPIGAIYRKQLSVKVFLPDSGKHFAEIILEGKVPDLSSDNGNWRVAEMRYIRFIDALGDTHQGMATVTIKREPYQYVIS